MQNPGACGVAIGFPSSSTSDSLEVDLNIRATLTFQPSLFFLKLPSPIVFTMRTFVAVAAVLALCVAGAFADDEKKEDYGSVIGKLAHTHATLKSRLTMASLVPPCCRN